MQEHYVINKAASILFLIWHLLITVISIGYGSDISDVKGKQSLSTKALQHVTPFRCKLFDEAPENI